MQAPSLPRRLVRRGGGATRAVLLRCLLATAVVGSLAPLSPGAWAAEPEVPTVAPTDDRMREGLALQLAEDYDAAQRWSSEMRALHPDDAELALFETSTLYWRFLYDENDPRLDEPIEEAGRRAVKLCRASLDRDSERARTHFQCGQAYADLVRLYGSRRRFLRAALIAERGQYHLERALELNPDESDAKYMLGHGLYWIAALPGVIQKLDWLWFIPEGDRERGRAYLQEVASSEGPYHAQALYLLSEIHAFEEGLGSRRGLALIEQAHRELPQHTLFHARLIRILLEQGQYGRAIQEAELLAKSPAPSREARGHKALGQIWRARAELSWGDTEAAAKRLEALGDAHPDLPSWAEGWQLLTRADLTDRAGRPEDALALYTQVTELERTRRTFETVRLARTGIARLEYRRRLAAQSAAAGGGASP